jgi:hypothetical protein
VKSEENIGYLLLDVNERMPFEKPRERRQCGLGGRRLPALCCQPQTANQLKSQEGDERATKGRQLERHLQGRAEPIGATSPDRPLGARFSFLLKDVSIDR